jgi:hypothetical protein
MINGMRSHSGLHPFRHEALRFVGDHVVLLRDEEPGRPVFPERSIDRNSSASWRNRCRAAPKSGLLQSRCKLMGYPGVQTIVSAH